MTSDDLNRTQETNPKATIIKEIQRRLETLNYPNRLSEARVRGLIDMEFDRLARLGSDLQTCAAWKTAIMKIAFEIARTEEIRRREAITQLAQTPDADAAAK